MNLVIRTCLPLVLICHLCKAIVINTSDPCPLTELEWKAKGAVWKCDNGEGFFCSLNEDATFINGCLPPFYITQNTVGCPFVVSTTETLVYEGAYTPCNTDLVGCPPKDHPGYTILQLYKYPLCLIRPHERNTTLIYQTEYTTSNSTNRKMNVTTTYRSNTNGVHVGIVIGIVGATILVIVLGVITILTKWKRYKKRRKGEHKVNEESILLTSPSPELEHSFKEINERKQISSKKNEMTRPKEESTISRGLSNDEKKQFLKNRDESQTTLRNVRLMAIGHKGVGKSTLIYRLKNRGKPITYKDEKKIQPTERIETDINYAVYNETEQLFEVLNEAEVCKRKLGLNLTKTARTSKTTPQQKNRKSKQKKHSRNSYEPKDADKKDGVQENNAEPKDADKKDGIQENNPAERKDQVKDTDLVKEEEQDADVQGSKDGKPSEKIEKFFDQRTDINKDIKDAKSKEIKENTLYQRKDTHKGGMTVSEKPVVESKRKSEALKNTSDHTNTASVKKEIDIEAVLKQAKVGNEEEYFLSLWDFAGNDEYHDTHIAFMSPDAIYLLLFDVNEMERQSHKAKIEQRQIKHLEFWLQNVSSLQSNKCTFDESINCIPKVIIIGTHTDELEKRMTATEFEHCCKDICKIVREVADNQNALGHVHTILLRDMKHTSTDDIWKNIEELKDMQEHWNEIVPTKLSILEYIIFDERQKGKKFIGIDKITEIWKAISDTDYVEKNLLMYLNILSNSGNILYIQESKTIILKPSWIIEMFGKIFSPNYVRNQKTLHTLQKYGKISKHDFEALFMSETIGDRAVAEDALQFLGLIVESDQEIFIPSFLYSAIDVNSEDIDTLKASINARIGLQMSNTLDISFTMNNKSLDSLFFYKVLTVLLQVLSVKDKYRRNVTDRKRNETRIEKRCGIIHNSQKYGVIYEIVDSSLRLKLFGNEEPSFTSDELATLFSSLFKLSVRYHKKPLQIKLTIFERSDEKNAQSENYFPFHSNLRHWTTKCHICSDWRRLALKSNAELIFMTEDGQLENNKFGRLETDVVFACPSHQQFTQIKMTSVAVPEWPLLIDEVSLLNRCREYIDGGDEEYLKKMLEVEIEEVNRKSQTRISADNLKRMIGIWMRLHDKPEILTTAIELLSKLDDECWLENLELLPKDCLTPIPMLLYAGRMQKEKTVKYLLQRLQCIDYTDETLKTILHYCVLMGSKDLAEEVIEKDNSLINQCDKDGRNAFSMAVTLPNLDMAEFLLEKGTIAQDMNYEAVVKECLNHQCPNLLRKIFISMQMKKARMSDLGKVFRTLLSTYNGDDLFAIELALESFPDMLSNAEYYLDDHPLIWVMKVKPNRTSPGPFILARMNNKELSKIKDSDGFSALHVGIKHCSLVELILKHDDGNFLLNKVDRENNTPIMYAVNCESKYYFNILLRQPHINITNANSRGQNVLHLVVRNNWFDECKEILQGEDKNGQRMFNESIRINLLKGQDEFGMSPIMFAVKQFSNICLLQLLLDEGSELRQMDRKHKTVYHHLVDNYSKEVKTKWTEMAGTLMKSAEYRATSYLFKVKSRSGQSLIDIARSKGCLDLLRTLDAELVSEQSKDRHRNKMFFKLRRDKREKTILSPQKEHGYSRITWELERIIKTEDNPEEVKALYSFLKGMGEKYYKNYVRRDGNTEGSFLRYAVKMDRRGTVLFFLQRQKDGLHVFEEDTYDADKNSSVLDAAKDKGWSDVVDVLQGIYDPETDEVISAEPKKGVRMKLLRSDTEL